MLNEQIVEALTRLADGLEQLEQRIRRIEATYIGSLPRNDYGLTDYDRKAGWRMMQVATGAATPKQIANRLPPEPREKEPEPEHSPHPEERYER